MEPAPETPKFGAGTPAQVDDDDMPQLDSDCGMSSVGELELDQEIDVEDEGPEDKDGMLDTKDE